MRTNQDREQPDTTRMYIREIARLLYQIMGRLEELERTHEAEPSGGKRDEMGRELSRLRAEYHKVKNILEGAKHSSE